MKNLNETKATEIKNIPSFDAEDVDIELKPLNVLIGANASGKSNFIKVLKILFSLPMDSKKEKNGKYAKRKLLPIINFISWFNVWNPGFYQIRIV